MYVCMYHTVCTVATYALLNICKLCDIPQLPDAQIVKVLSSYYKAMFYKDYYTIGLLYRIIIIFSYVRMCSYTWFSHART